jgi:hypothetical protein
VVFVIIDWNDATETPRTPCMLVTDMIMMAIASELNFHEVGDQEDLGDVVEDEDHRLDVLNIECWLLVRF